MGQPGEQIYRLKFDLLLTILQVNQQTCKIWTKVAPATLAAALRDGRLGRGKDKLPCAIELMLLDGQVTAAFIRDQHGQILAQGEAALAACRRCGELAWYVQPTPPQSQEVSPMKGLIADPPMEVVEKQRAPRAWSQRAPPRWTHALAQEEVDGLPRRHRQVLLLIDGKRGVDELCRVLNCPPDQIVVILNELIARKLIFFTHNDE